MARYIDAEELVKRINDNIKPETLEEKALIEWCKDECIRQAYCMPTADVVPKSEGCEFCGTTLYVKTVQHTMPLLAPITRADELRHELLNLTGEIYLPLEAKFCPVCGAKMKGGAE